MDAGEVQQELLTRLDEAGLSNLVVQSHSQDLGGELFVEVVLSDGAKVDEVSGVAKKVLKDANCDERNYSLVVRPKWEIEKIGDMVPAYGPSGGLRAATLIPVTIRSGNTLTTATVSVTKLAEMNLDQILGRKADLREVARIVIDGALSRTGSSAWDPTVEDYLEVASGAAANLSRMLRRTA